MNPKRYSRGGAISYVRVTPAADILNTRIEEYDFGNDCE